MQSTIVSITLLLSALAPGARAHGPEEHAHSEPGVAALLAERCGKCHGADASGEARAHFDLGAMPPGGHHAAELGDTFRRVLGADGMRATMPRDAPGSLSEKDTALLVAWADGLSAAAAGHGDGMHGMTMDGMMHEAQPPRAMFIPGRPGDAGQLHLMWNAFAFVQNVGVDGYRITNEGVDGFDAGEAQPVFSGDWVMGYYRDEAGWGEALVMLDFEPLTVGSAGVPELGQYGEGLYDSQHSHLFVHQAMVALHPLALARGWRRMEREPDLDIALFAGQGGATIGPPIFMHRASNPSPTVPRKHHKGENPHETSAVLGMSVRYHGTWLEGSVFGARELGPEDSRWKLYPAAPESFALRLRQDLGAFELQVSGERKQAQGDEESDATQLSASVYGGAQLGGWRLDGILDWAVDIESHGALHGGLLELALRTPDVAQTFWTRVELNEREERDETSALWTFASLGFEQRVAGSEASIARLGLLAELTWIDIPDALVDTYGQSQAVTVLVGLRLSGMMMPLMAH